MGVRRPRIIRSTQTDIPSVENGYIKQGAAQPQLPLSGKILRSISNEIEPTVSRLIRGAIVPPVISGKTIRAFTVPDSIENVYAKIKVGVLPSRVILRGTIADSIENVYAKIKVGVLPSRVVLRGTIADSIENVYAKIKVGVLPSRVVLRGTIADSIENVYAKIKVGITPVNLSGIVLRGIGANKIENVYAKLNSGVTPSRIALRGIIADKVDNVYAKLNSGVTPTRIALQGIIADKVDNVYAKLNSGVTPTKIALQGIIADKVDNVYAKLNSGVMPTRLSYINTTPHVIIELRLTSSKLLKGVIPVAVYYDYFKGSGREDDYFGYFDELPETDEELERFDNLVWELGSDEYTKNSEVTFEQFSSKTRVYSRELDNTQKNQMKQLVKIIDRKNQSAIATVITHGGIAYVIWQLAKLFLF